MSGLVLQRLVLGELNTNCWLVSDDAAGPIVVVDPASDAEEILATIGERHVAAVVLTHGHFDHLGAVREIVRATGAPLAVHASDAGGITTAEGNGAAFFGHGDLSSPPADRMLTDGDVIEAGALTLRVIHTPGHTPGSICLFADVEGGPHLMSGDTLFSGTVGRTDFRGGDAAAMRSSIAKLAALPLATLVHPGHGPDTSLARESRVNVFWPRA